jgi:cysteine desulfurase
MQKMVYIDNNATTAVAPEVVEAMLPFFETRWGNPSSLHTFGSSTKRYLDEAREKVAALIGASDAGEIIFTSCGSESNNMAIRGAVSAMRKKPYVITSQVEHSAVLGPCSQLEERGRGVSRIPVDAKGRLELDPLKEILAACENPVLASFMWANNETGVIFPMAELEALIHNNGGVFHTDAVQAVGKLAINVQSVPVDMLSISGHKLHAPKGIGALYVRRGTRVNPLLLGGHQERARRAGTENVPYIVGLGKACELAMEKLEEDARRETALRDRLEAGILATCKGAAVNGDPACRLPNTTNISFEHLEGEGTLLMLDDVGICTSTGAACESGSIEASHVLKAMKVPAALVQGAIRFSLSRYTTDEDIDYVLARLPAIIERQRALSPRIKD